jgi:hypothetical protein
MKAMNDIVIVQMPTQMPLRDASACADRTFAEDAALTDGYVVDDIISFSPFEVLRRTKSIFRCPGSQFAQLADGSGESCMM